jgi:uncharacterized membrane protein YsdA (DUF1294 family)
MSPIGALEFGIYLLGINLACFGAFALDKRRARDNDKRRSSDKGQRIPERRLVLLCAIGGSIGGLLARHFLRHKTVKEPFSTILALIVVVQIGCAVLLGVLAAYTALGFAN